MTRWRQWWVDWRRDRERGRLLLATLALLATFLQPGLPWKQTLFEHVIVLDVTQSMNVQDQSLDGRPASRLVFAKHALNHALQLLPCGSKVGWAIFTEYRSYLLFTPVEVCANRAELRATLARIDGRMAWSGNSEVAKGLHSGVLIAKALPGTPSLVFLTDGHEAPPLHPRHRPPFDDKSGKLAGLIVGVGELKPSPIPKTDPRGRPLGFWAADEVLQIDVYSHGRSASVSGEKMVEDTERAAPVGVGATPGSEHLSSLREAYLRLLADENGFAFLRLRSVEELADALRSKALARPVAVRGDARVLLAAFAFLLLLLPYAKALWLRRRATSSG